MSKEIPKIDPASDYETLSRWQEQNPVVVPEDITELVRSRQAEMASPEISRKRWEQLIEENERRMYGISESDMLYQLAVHRAHVAGPVQADDGVRALIGDLESRLRPCWCGSGKKFKECHGN
jgi:uncharacterized protein YecA (UPF0149 family)